MGVVTLLEKIRSVGEMAEAAEAVVDLCARWSLQPCTNQSRPRPAYGECRHCIAEEILIEIGKALEVYP